MKKINLLLLVLLIIGCKNTDKNLEKAQQLKVKQTDIVSTIINEKDNFYYLDTTKYPVGDSSLPIGVFDSGTGGLTVLKAIVGYDQNQNTTLEKGSDGILDFNKESFTYLADQANMPYGSYPKENNIALLKEHIIKDAQFLMGSNYYSDRNDKTVNTGKKQVKALVIACNTATAYGKEYIEEFLEKAKLNIKVIGVIDAGARGALASIKKDEDAIIGVFATIATVGVKGYDKAIFENKDKMSYTGEIEVFSQGGIGLAEVIDEDPDYYEKNLKKPRKGYQGPALDGNEFKIDKALYDVYNFDFNDNKMLCDSKNTDDCSILQINDAENYCRYHLVSLMEKIRLSKTKNKLKSLILGCTHYPYMTKEIDNIFKELYNYKAKDGSYLYRDFMAESINLIDPAIYTAKALFEYLKQEKLLNPNGDIKQSEFYISVANNDNTNNAIDENGRFPYEYKYGRNANEIQEYVKVVPFSRKNISNDILLRLKEQTPFVYELMRNFNLKNAKTSGLSDSSKI
jgi:glutamate racemase